MIRAMIFDLDGTLVQTERLKAISYARAAMELCAQDISEDEVLDAYKEVVGRSRHEVATALLERFDLGEAARERMDEFGVHSAWQAYVQVRLDYYEDLVSDPEVLLANQWPHNLELLKIAKEISCTTALATTSDCEHTQHVLKTLDLTAAFDFVASRDDVEQTKPDPEIYQLISRHLEVPPGQCLVIEDAPSGIKAAQAADMWCIAVTTPFTHRRVHEEGILDRRWIVDNSEDLLEVVKHMIRERREDG
jgi:beta-phosphoglucomutase